MVNSRPLKDGMICELINNNNINKKTARSVIISLSKTSQVIFLQNSSTQLRIFLT